jgi:hypothetical protein
MADYIRPTPRNPLLGLLSDAITGGVDWMRDPRRAQQMQGFGGLLAETGIPATLERLSYGEPLTTGRGMTTRLRPEAESALMTLGPEAVPIGRGAMAAVRATKGLPVGASIRSATGSPNAIKMGDIKIDPRFDPRVNEQQRIAETVTQVEPTGTRQIPTVSLAQFEGRPFITSMSDRTAAGGNLVQINDVVLNRPVGLLGGQDYMLNNPGQVWASATTPVRAIMGQAQTLREITGQNPLFLPWRMAPTGGDFAAMTGETMLSYADANLGKRNKARLDKQIKQFIPDWSGVSSSASVQQFRDAPDQVRKAVKNMMDVEFRDIGGLNIGQARLAVSDPRQFSAQDAGVMNVGEIFANKPMIEASGHPSYPRGVPGQGFGLLSDDINVFQLLPNVVRERGIQNPMQPAATDIRALQMKPYAGIITEDVLRALGY